MIGRFVVLLFVLATLLGATIVLAQEINPVPTPDAATRAESAADRAAQAAGAARLAANDASSYLGIFEGIGTLIGVMTGIFVPALAVVAGFVGLNRLSHARDELSDAQKKFEADLDRLRVSIQDDLRSKQDELDALKDDLRKSAEEERLKSVQASFALSLLPLGERQYQFKDLDGALSTYQQALNLDPDNIVILYKLGYVYVQMGMTDEARIHLERALTLQSDFAPALATLGYVERRVAEPLSIQSNQRGQQLARAEQLIRQALAISPKLVDEDGESWWGSLGGLHRRRGQIDEAIDCYVRATEVTPQASYPYGNLAQLYLLRNDRAHMREMYQQTERLALRRVMLDTTDFWAFADLLVAQLALGKTADAGDTLAGLFGAAPLDAPNMLDRPLATLRQLAGSLGGSEAAQMQPFITRIEAQISAGRLNERG